MRSLSKAKHLAGLAMFTALAMILSYVEILIPVSFGIPGVKLGLTNLVTVLILMTGKSDRGYDAYRLFDALIVVIARIVLVGFLFTDLYAMIYSLSGGLFSLLFMWLFSGSLKLSAAGISVIGGIAHNFAQLVVAALVVEQLRIFYYAPVLLFSGTLTGFLIGIVANLIINRRGVTDYYDRFFKG